AGTDVAVRGRGPLAGGRGNVTGGRAHAHAVRARRFRVGRGHVCTPRTWVARIPASASGTTQREGHVLDAQLAAVLHAVAVRVVPHDVADRDVPVEAQLHAAVAPLFPYATLFRSAGTDVAVRGRGPLAGGRGNVTGGRAHAHAVRARRF